MISIIHIEQYMANGVTQLITTQQRLIQSVKIDESIDFSQEGAGL